MSIRVHPLIRAVKYSDRPVAGNSRIAVGIQHVAMLLRDKGRPRHVNHHWRIFSALCSKGHTAKKLSSNTMRQFILPKPGG